MGISISSIQQMLTRYGMSTYVAFGNLGNLLLIGIFSQREQLQNPCSLYLLSMTICNLICLDVGIIPIIFSLDHQDISNKYLTACKIQFYIRHSFFQMMRTYKVAICIDRYTICSQHNRIRSFSQRKIATYLILITGLFWLLLCIFFGYIRTIENGSCNVFDNVYSMIYTIYYMIFAGIVPPFLMIIFTILVIRNLKQLRNRIQPKREQIIENKIPNQSIQHIRKRDKDLIKMVFIEVIVYVLSTLPFSIYLIYKMATDSLTKTKERQQIESFINYIAQSFIMYLNTALPFYVYLLTSPSFRKQTKLFIIKIYAFILGKQIRQQQTNDTTQTINTRN